MVIEMESGLRRVDLPEPGPQFRWVEMVSVDVFGPHGRDGGLLGLEMATGCRRQWV
jgi:hypothetical protein